MASIHPPKLQAQIAQSYKREFSEEPPKPTHTLDPQTAAAEHAHIRSQFVLREHKSPWPRVAVMKKYARNEWTIPYVKSKIAELRKEHRQQLAKAIRYQGREELQMKNDEYASVDELTDWPADLMETIEILHCMEHRLQMYQANDFISHLRYTHIIALKPFYARLHRLLLAEETAKGQRARLFPKSSQAWREIDTRDAKLKVAKFLLMDKKQQDDILEREILWRGNRPDVDRVVLEYKSNIVFSQEVRSFVKESQTTDPRRRLT